MKRPGGSEALEMIRSITLLLCAVSLSQSLRNPPFRSLKAPKEIIKNYTIHQPVVRIVEEGPSNSNPLNLQLHIAGYLIHLELNRDLVPAQFTSHYFDENEERVIETGHENCFYHGTVESFPEWHVVMSTCSGLRGSFGTLGDREKYFHIEPLNDNNPSLDQPHALYPASELSDEERTCGVGDEDSSRPLPSPTLHKDIHDLDDIHIDHKRLRRLVNGFYIVEWAVVNDFQQYVSFERNLSATVLRDLEIANFVDSVYRTLNVRVVVVHVLTWTTRNMIAYPSDDDPDVILNNFRDYEPQITAPHDSAMLITGVDLLSTTVGVAFLSTMCGGRFSTGLSQDGRGSLEAVGTTAAHELGHIFSMRHDTTACTCTDPSGGCIMAASSGFPKPTEWSSCSRGYIQTGFSDDNLNRCLDNAPEVTVGDPTCGNGIREGDEICDCGTPEECTDPCCNAMTCRLTENAQCPNGECCTDDCQFKTLGTECRAASDECDIAEFCLGNSSSCPSDRHIQDGTACNSKEHFCFAGVCQNRDSQCMKFFGSPDAVSQCYDLNTRGEGRGNCGYSGGSFLPCEPKHVLCGQLQCQGGQFVGEVDVFFTIYTLTFGNGDVCRSFSTSPTSDTPLNPGLVQDGTRCGNASVCVSQRCTRLEDLSYIQACPVGANGQTCSGEGACNDLNQCSCGVGLAGATCEQSVGGDGGGGGGSNAGAVAGAVIGTLLGLALVVGVVVGVVIVVVKVRSKYSKPYYPKVENGTSKNRSPRPNASPKNRPATTANRPPPRSSPSTPRPPPSSASKPHPPPPSKAVPPPPTRSEKQPPPRKAAPTTPKPPVSRPPPPRSSPKVAPSTSAPPQRRNIPPPQPQYTPNPAARTKLSPVKPNPGKIQAQWPPPKDEDSNKPLPPVGKKPINPPPRRY